MKPIVLVGSLDTKGAEFQLVRDLIHAQGLETLMGSLQRTLISPRQSWRMESVAVC